MELSYTLSTNDYLELQLYNLSHNSGYKKQRKWDRYRLPGLSLLFGAILLFDGMNDILAYVFIASSLLFFMFYQRWSAWMYKRMSKRKVIESMKGESLYEIKLLLGNDVIEVDSKRGHNFFNVHDIKSIIEIERYFFLMMNQYVYIIIPKDQIVDKEQLAGVLEGYRNTKGIPLIHELEWEWK